MTKIRMPYGDHPRMVLDVHQPPPDSQADRLAPVVIFLHGGGWRSCSCDDSFHAGIGTALASAGILAVTPNYRLFPEVRFPAFVEDAARAVAVAKAHAVSLGGDPTRLVLAGYSAGAHIAALLSYDPRYLEACNLRIGTVSGFIGLSGYYEFDIGDDSYVDRIFPAEALAAAQPARLVRPTAPAALLVQGARDTIVNPIQADRLEAALLAVKSPVKVMRLPDDDHHSYLRTLQDSPERSSVLAALAEFAYTCAATLLPVEGQSSC